MTQKLMMRLFLAICIYSLAVLKSPGDEMTGEGIRQLVKQVDDSLFRGHIYHIVYLVSEKRLDSFYDHRKQLIEYLGDAITKSAQETPASAQDAAFVESQNVRQNLSDGFKRDLTLYRECNYSSDYSVDGTGFYLKRSMFFVNASGIKSPTRTSIYASDGKVMGSFYLDNSQAVIEPATERPHVPEEYWTDIVYNFLYQRISSFIASIPTLKMTNEAGKLVITGEQQGDGKSRTQVETRIDQATLTPEAMTMIYFDTHGTLHSKIIKTWQYQDVVGTRVPKVVTEQDYETDLSGNLGLETERTLTISEFSATAASTKDAFHDLLKSGFSVFDEITGSHYISGSPGNVLDKLSQ